jgi:hypothetical protein
MLPP